MCRISVVMSVYNAEKYVGETIESVLNQTYRDFEYIIIDDNSPDRSADIIEEYSKQDKRIRFVRNTDNQGQCKNLNTGIGMAKGEYIARLDHDDLCYPKRFEKQLRYMEKNEKCVLLGTEVDLWEDGNIRKSGDVRFDSPEELKFYTFFDGPMAHSSFFIRKSALTENHIEYGDYKYAEDYALVNDLLEVGEVYKLPEPLVTYRIFPEQTTKTVGNTVIKEENVYIRNKKLEKTEFEEAYFLKRANEGKLNTKEDFDRIENTLLALAKYCGITDPNITDKRYFRLAIAKAYEWQRGNMAMLMSYMRNEVFGKGRKPDRVTLSIIKKSIHKR